MKSDPQVLCEAMGKCWHEWEWTPSPFGPGPWNTPGYNKCKKCGAARSDDPRSQHPNRNPTFTRPEELWGLLQYMMGREDWGFFYDYALNKYAASRECLVDMMMGPVAIYFAKWLLHPTRLVELAAGWIRQKGGK